MGLLKTIGYLSHLRDRTPRRDVELLPGHGQLVLQPGVDARRRSEFPGHLQPGLMQVYGNDIFTAAQTSAHDRRQPDRSNAEHHDAGTGRWLKRIHHGTNTGGQPAPERTHQLQWQVAGNPDRAASRRDRLGRK